MNASSHKTVFVLDHSPYFANSCGQAIELDWFKTKTGFSCKSLWTCSIEAALEYHRVITDLFPTDKLLRFVISDSVGRVVTEQWSEEAMNLETVMQNFAQIGPPDANGDQSNCCIINGLSLAIEALIQCSKKQSGFVKRKLKVENFGRIVVITHVKQSEEIKMIEDHVNELIEGQNKIGASLGESFLPLKLVELCLINTYPLQGVEMKLPHRPLCKISDVLHSEFHSWRTGTYLTSKIHALCQRHFDLASTTVGGIPMKEEQNAGATSSNYDVELLHHKDVHDELFKCMFDPTFMDKRDGYMTLTLKWCTPTTKSGSEQIYQTNVAFKATPVEVNSRPSACLTSFLLSGRTVVLELPKRSGVKTVSHILTCHLGYIYIHSLYLGRNPLDEPPSISEGPGGRLTDYRISQFAEFFKECSLHSSENVKGSTLEKNLKHLERLSNYCPLTLNETVIFSVSGRFEPLFSLLKKRLLTDSEVFECKKVIFSVSTMEANGETLSSSVQMHKLKGLKKADQYKFVWNELELYLRNYSHYSPSHHAILNTLLQIIGKPLETFIKIEDKVENNDESIGNPARRDSLSVKLASSGSVDGFSVADNPESPPLSPGFSGSSTVPKRPKLEAEDMSGGNGSSTVNLLALITKKYQDDKLANWKDFDARTSSVGSKVELYPDLMRKLDGGGGGGENANEKAPIRR